MARTTTAKYTRTCVTCGAEMHNVGPTRQYCPACLGKRAAEALVLKKKLLREEKMREKMEREALEEKARKAFPHPKKPTQDNSIGAVCARAIAAGRTYGQQVEFERRQKELKDRGEI